MGQKELSEKIIGGNVIKSVNTYKILGVIMDNNLNWNSHVDFIIKKACQKFFQKSHESKLRCYIHLEFCAEPGCPNPTCWGYTLPKFGQFWSVQYRSGRIYLPICRKP